MTTRPETTVREIADGVFARRLEQEWYLRLRQGLPVEHLRVECEQAWADDARYAEDTLARLHAVEVLDEDDRLTAGFLEHLLGRWVARMHYPLLGFTVTPYQTMSLMQALQQVFPTFTGSGGTYLGLVADLRDQVEAMTVRLARQREAGVLVPRPALAGIRESLRRAGRAAEGALVASAPPDARDGVERLVRGELLPAFDRLLSAMDETYEHDAPHTVGMAQYPSGADAYRLLVRENTASELTPERLHELGLAQVEELADKMARARSSQGFGGSEAEFHAMLATDSRVHATSPEDVEALFDRHLARLEPLIGDYFSVVPKAPYAVVRLEPAAEAGLTYGYYEPPTASQPVGRYRWNGADLEHKSLLTYAALIFHELAPGHHFHVARQAENDALPTLRREALDIVAFNEGWAEYAAGLGWEMGLYDDPLDGYGRLVHERFTAQRLVVDTGMNLLGWSLDEGAAYMRAHTTESDAQIATEVLRYSTDLPAQALSYRAGFLELNRIRRAAEARLGDRFDIREFHEQLLGPGALPFPVLDGHVDRWAPSR